MKKIRLNIKQKFIGLAILVIASIIAALLNFSNSKNQKINDKSDNNRVEVGKGTEIESNSDTINKDDNVAPNYTNKELNIWIKNITFITDQGNTMDIMLKLKSKLSSELKGVDSEIYEVTLLEETYKKTDDGFEVEAKADKLDKNILIEYKDYEFIFTIVQ